jgi:tripartite ATP-independent transporter DctM subunit
MVKQGYPRVFATNVTICGSVQAILIPPSHNAVIYSMALGGTVSIAHLFVAGVVPGLLLGGSLIALCLFIARRENYPKGEVIPARQAAKIVIEALWGLGTMVIILGGILGGVFTATEAAAVACVYAFFVTILVYRDYKWRALPLLAHRTVKTVAMVMMLIAFASAFGYIMALMQLPKQVTEFFLTVSDDRYVILLLINLLLLVLGTLMDLAPLLLICAPILAPVVESFGVDLVHFGMIMLVNLGIGLVTPPVGSVLFVGCAVGKVTMEQAMQKIWPFYIAMLLVLVAVTYLPEVSLWLPDLLLN